LLYVGQACAGPVAGLAAQLAAKLTAGCTASAIGVTNYTMALWAVLIALMVWFKEFLALYRLAHALIQ